MLDFPELFAPARIVNGRMSISHSSAIDLKPFTAILVIPEMFFSDIWDMLLVIIVHLIAYLIAYLIVHIFRYYYNVSSI